MTEAPRHLIRGPDGIVRVLRLCAHDSHVVMLHYGARRGQPGFCRLCGCTEVHACLGGCSWIDSEHTVCSRCSGRTLT